MNIVRFQPAGERQFAVIDKAASENSRLSWEARGVLAYLYGLEPGREISVPDLLRRGPGGPSYIFGILDELSAAGYIKMETQP